MGTKQYLETEVAQIKSDHKASGSELPLDEYALEWIEENAARYAEEHERELES